MDIFCPMGEYQLYLLLILSKDCKIFFEFYLSIQIHHLPYFICISSNRNGKTYVHKNLQKLTPKYRLIQMHLKGVNSYLGIISIHNIIPAKILTLDDILRSHEYYHKTMYHVFGLKLSIRA